MKTLFLFLILGINSLSIGQTFPKDWVGHYRGYTITGTAGKPNDTIPTEFVMEEIIADSVWSYTMTYFSERYGDLVKDYRIVRVAKGDSVNYLFDEQNGIMMELTLLNGCFYGMYDVVGQRYVSTLRHNKLNGLIMELFMAPDNDPMVTKVEEEGQVFEASSYKPVLHQSVFLQKIEE